ncbi:hypothetical protein EON79_08800 [bacterium]|nr:MAG: hypothetical protein EON79_08800 [bacterium]
MNPTPDGAPAQYGTIQTRATINGSAIVHDLPSISSVALAGVVNEATYRPQGPPDNETAIATLSGNFIDLQLESGEKVATWQPTGAAGSAIQMQWSLDGQKLYVLYAQLGLGTVYSVSTANPTTLTSVVGPDILNFDLSPDGTRIAYTRQVGDTEVFVRGISGGAVTQVTNNAQTDVLGSWAVDNNLLIYNSGVAAIQTVNLSGTVLGNFYPLSITQAGRSADARFIVNQFAVDNSNYAFSISERNGSTYNSQDYLGTGYGPALSASPSPDGQRWAINTGFLIYTTELFPKYPATILEGSPTGYRYVAWQPALGVTKFVGSSSKLSIATGAGIIATSRAGNGRNGLSSFVVWDAETRSTSKVSEEPTSPEAGLQTYVIEVDRLTALKYANRPLFTGVSTINAAGTANGAIVTVDTSTGIVKGLIVYGETRGARPTIRQDGTGRSVEGAIVGVWDEKGRNLAPQGANRVGIDAKGVPSVER